MENETGSRSRPVSVSQVRKILLKGHSQVGRMGCLLHEQTEGQMNMLPRLPRAGDMDLKREPGARGHLCKWKMPKNGLPTWSANTGVELAESRSSM